MSTAVQPKAKSAAGSPKTKTKQSVGTTGEITAKVRAHVIGTLDLASDETRFRVLEMLSTGERNVGPMCETLGQTQPAVSHHLSLLRHARLIEPRREGKNNFYRLTDQGKALWAACSTYAAAITAGTP